MEVNEREKFNLLGGLRQKASEVSLHPLSCKFVQISLNIAFKVTLKVKNVKNVTLKMKK